MSKDLPATHFYFSAANRTCALFNGTQGYTMYGIAGRSYFVLEGNDNTKPNGVCPLSTNLRYALMSLAYGSSECLPAYPFTNNGTYCSLSHRPTIGAYHGGYRNGNYVSYAKSSVVDSLNYECDSPMALIAKNDNNTWYCYAYFTYPNGSDPQATCDHKFPGSTVVFTDTNIGHLGHAFLPSQGVPTKGYVFYGNTGPSTARISPPYVQCAKQNPAGSSLLGT